MVSNILCFHPYLGKIPILTHIVQRGGSTTNQIRSISLDKLIAAKHQSCNTQNEELKPDLLSINFFGFQVPLTLLGVQCLWPPHAVGVLRTVLLVGAEKVPTFEAFDANLDHVASNQPTNPPTLLGEMVGNGSIVLCPAMCIRCKIYKSIYPRTNFQKYTTLEMISVLFI